MKMHLKERLQSNLEEINNLYYNSMHEQTQALYILARTQTLIGLQKYEEENNGTRLSNKS